MKGRGTILEYLDTLVLDSAKMNLGICILTILVPWI